jgi:hypothetical protein
MFGVLEGAYMLATPLRVHQCTVWVCFRGIVFLQVWVHFCPVWDLFREIVVLQVWKAGVGDRRQEIAFFGVGLKRGAITAALEACLMTPDEMASFVIPKDPFAPWPCLAQILGAGHDSGSITTGLSETLDDGEPGTTA